MSDPKEPQTNADVPYTFTLANEFVIIGCKFTSTDCACGCKNEDDCHGSPAQSENDNAD